MPTGYTYKIEEGCTFNEFIMKCARAFGALIHMRDSSQGAEIPDVIEPNDYHAKALTKAKARLSEVSAMSVTEIDAARKAEFATSLKSSRESNEQRAMNIERYNHILAQVQDWEPPTSDHQDLKRFMIEQIEISVPKQYECDAPLILSAEAWLEDARESANRDIKYHTEKNEKEIERCKEKTQWVNDLRASLKGD